MKVIIKCFIKCVIFCVNGMKFYSVVGMIDVKNEWVECIVNGVEVIDYNIDKMFCFEYVFMVCVG